MGKHFDFPNDWQVMADIANAKLEREGKIVFSIGPEALFTSDYKSYFQNKPSHKALLINIEPIESCKHINIASLHWLNEKSNKFEDICFTCQECGVKLKPSNFEEVV